MYRKSMINVQGGMEVSEALADGMEACHLPSMSSGVKPRKVFSLEVSAILESFTEKSTSRLRVVPIVTMLQSAMAV